MKRFKIFLICGVAQVGIFVAAAANAAFGSVPRPIIFVHGIASDGYGTWGFEKPTCDYFDKIEYRRDDTPAIVSNRMILYVATCRGGTTFSGKVELPYQTAEEFRSLYGNDTVVLTQKIAPNNLHYVAAKNFDYVASKNSHNYKEAGRWRVGCLGDLNADPSHGGTLSCIPLQQVYESIRDTRNRIIPINDKTWELGFSIGYKPNSTPAYFAQRYSLDTHFDKKHPGERINHNGLEFFNLFKDDPWNSNKTGWQHPARQASGLYYKLTAVLDEYYDDWQTNPDRQIDLIAHSQGGLVIRSMLQQWQGSGSDTKNPLNHIHHIVTVDTPHLGTAFVHDHHGVPPLEDLRDFVLRRLERMDSVKVTPWASMDFIEASMLDPIFDLNQNAQHLRYACGLANQNWEPRESFVYQRAIRTEELQKLPDVDIDCSEYIGDLRKEGFPRAPNNKLIPMTTLYGRVNPKHFNEFIDRARNTAVDSISNFEYVMTGGDANEKVRTIFDEISRISKSGLSEQWLPNSDFVVDVSSQVGLGLFNERLHPFRKAEIKPINPEVGVYHNDWSMLEPTLGQKIPGAAWHGEEIFNALQNKPKAKVNLTAPFLLLLQH